MQHNVIGKSHSEAEWLIQGLGQRNALATGGPRLIGEPEIPKCVREKAATENLGMKAPISDEPALALECRLLKRALEILP